MENILINNTNNNNDNTNNNSTDNINIDRIKKKKKKFVLKGESTVKRLTDGYNVVDLIKLENIIKGEGVSFENTGITLMNVKGDTLITTKPFNFILDIAKPLLYCL